MQSRAMPRTLFRETHITNPEACHRMLRYSKRQQTHADQEGRCVLAHSTQRNRFSEEIFCIDVPLTVQKSADTFVPWAHMFLRLGTLKPSLRSTASSKQSPESTNHNTCAISERIRGFSRTFLNKRCFLQRQLLSPPKCLVSVNRLRRELTLYTASILNSDSHWTRN